ncbi:MAG: 50S ribosomal protein L22 [Candidatus Dadabacteria bacterium]|nr:MAG: 50S ribosomal protein L22 [Candidatus Dadabacteria bacterium]
MTEEKTKERTEEEVEGTNDVDPVEGNVVQVRKRKKKPHPRKNLQGGLVKVSLRQVRISPRKARLVLGLIKGKQVGEALNILRFTPKKGARLVEKLLLSGISAARERFNADTDALWVTGGWVDMGKTMMRYMPRAHGRATPIRKRSSHITLFLDEI